ncbi:MAG: PKD domain-containing protein, partial [Candidatus Caldatribacteriaceae bacterium]
VLSPGGFLILGAEPRALVGVDPKDGSVIWAGQLYHLPFERGPKNRPDRGELQHYCSLGVTDEGDIIFGGVYELAYTPAYRKPDAFVCRLSPHADSVKWAKYIADTPHGGFGSVNAIATHGDSLYLVGTTSATFDPRTIMNANLLAVKMSKEGEVAWLCSLGKKKKSEAQSEYREEIGNDLVVAGKSVMVVGATDAFALPDPGFHRVRQWAERRFDMLLARTTSCGEIRNLPEGRHPRFLSRPDVSDPKKVDIVSVPVAVRDFSVSAVDFTCSARPISCSALSGDLQVQFSTVHTTGGMEIAGAGNRPPAADFTLLEPSSEGELRVCFDGTVSTDPDGDEIAWYRWDFGDGETSTSPKPMHMYPRSVRTPQGTTLLVQFYDVTLTVWDSRYNESSITKRIATGYDVRGKGIPAAFCADRLARYDITIETGEEQHDYHSPFPAASRGMEKGHHGRQKNKPRSDRRVYHGGLQSSPLQS